MVEKTKAYIAGFLDGDGSIFFQLIKKNDYKFGYQIRASIVFYQKDKNIRILNWFKNKLRVGYIRNRNDQMVEYTIVGLKEVFRVLSLINNYLILKKPQANLAMRIIRRIGKGIDSAGKLLRIAKEVDKFGVYNYSKKRKRKSGEVRKFLLNHKFLSP